MINLKIKPFSLLLHLILLFLVVDSGCVQPKYNNSAIEARFKSWMQHHDMHYKDKEEWMLRFGIYQANLNFINYINSQNLSYKLGDNNFADLTNDEFKALYFGHRRLIVPRSSDHNSTLPKPYRVSVKSSYGPAPAAVDWRKKGAVNPIKMQGKCESDWAFSAVGGVESAVQIKTGKLVSLSEQELLSCDTEGMNKGCKKGYKTEGYDYIQAKGVSTDKEYPYTGTETPCKAPTKKTAKILKQGKVAYNNEAALMEAVAQQPVSASLEGSGKEFQLYKSGIFNGNCGIKMDQDLVIVGYGEEGGQKYWIIRNSWNTTWGEAGYMRILRGGAKKEGTCGLAQWPTYPVLAN